MKRDMKLATKVLEFVEKNGSRTFAGPIPIEGYDRNSIIYHLHLLVNAGFVQLGEDTLANAGVLMLTWKGCDYLDELRAKQAAQDSSSHGLNAASVPKETNRPARNPSIGGESQQQVANRRPVAGQPTVRQQRPVEQSVRQTQTAVANSQSGGKPLSADASENRVSRPSAMPANSPAAGSSNNSQASSSSQSQGGGQAAAGRQASSAAAAAQLASR